MTQRTPRIGPAIRKERKLHKLTLEQLSAQSGVSKSMLSQIERGEANPTFAVVWSLTQALGIEFSELIGGSGAPPRTGYIEITTKTYTPQIWSADGLCRLKILSSPPLAGRMEWYEVEIEAGGRLESEPHAPGTFEHFTAQSEGFEITCGENAAQLREGETARYPADVSHCISNASNKPARGFLVVLYR
ncbi:helix-turn-helix transcriptional regulator [Chelatococcus asaccharovorans]|nr:helix-turn-helix transcriptional regulator [Chelatococcus asaccharovorans]